MASRETPALNGVAILFHTSVSVESLMSSWLWMTAAGEANFRKGNLNNVFFIAARCSRPEEDFFAALSPDATDVTNLRPSEPTACSNLIQYILLRE